MRKVFFSFHYARDCWSVSQVRNSWLLNPFHEAQPFYDKAHWEQVKRSGPANIRSWIDNQLKGTSVTVVLIGPDTLSRPWVKYEIDETLRLGKGLLGVTLENMKQSNQSIDAWNRYTTYGPLNGASGTHKVYSWITENGRQNLPHWIEDAAAKAKQKVPALKWI
jgi:hypothetical protein